MSKKEVGGCKREEFSSWADEYSGAKRKSKYCQPLYVADPKFEESSEVHVSSQIVVFGWVV